MSNNKLNRNILVSYVYNFLLRIDINVAIWVLYLSAKGMSLVEIGVIEAIFHITGLIFELPTGVIADIYGRKFSVILGRVLNVISFILIIISNSFIGIAIGFILSAAAMNLNSGAAEALVYDTLKINGEEDKYNEIFGRLSFIMSIAQGIAILLGGVLGEVNFLYAYILGLIIQIVALISSFFFKEPPLNKNKLYEKEENKLVSQLKISIKVLMERRNVLYLMLISAFIGSIGTSIFFYGQKYFEDLGYSKVVIAIIYTVILVIEGISSKYAYKVEKVFNTKVILIIIIALNTVSFFILGILVRLSILAFIIMSISNGISYTIFSNYINSRIPSEYRATILSVDSLIFSMFMIVIFPVFGIVAEILGFNNMFLIVFIFHAFIILINLKKKRVYNK